MAGASSFCRDQGFPCAYAARENTYPDLEATLIGTERIRSSRLLVPGRRGNSGSRTPAVGSSPLVSKLINTHVERTRLPRPQDLTAPACALNKAFTVRNDSSDKS